MPPKKESIYDKISNFISKVGFPIAMTLLISWYVVVKADKQTDLLNEIRLLLITPKSKVEFKENYKPKENIKLKLKNI